jgi:hypothetical protein
VIGESHAAVVEGAPRPADHQRAVAHIGVAERAGDADPRLAVDVAEAHRARDAAVRGANEPDGGGERGAAERVRDEGVVAQGIAEEDGATERYPAREGDRTLTVPERRGRLQGGLGAVGERDGAGVPDGEEVPAGGGEGVVVEALSGVAVVGTRQRRFEAAPTVRGVIEVATALLQQPRLAPRRRSRVDDGRRGGGTGVAATPE